MSNQWIKVDGARRYEEADKAWTRPNLRRFAMMLLALSVAFMFHPYQAQAQAADSCLYALDASAQGSFSISGSTSISTSCSAVVESSGTQAFQMSGTEVFYMQNNAQVGVVGGWNLSGQTKIVNQSTGQTEQPVKISSPGDPLAFLPIPASSTIVGRTPTSYDMNNKPPNNTLAPGIYCGGLTVGNTNGATFTMSPGNYIMAGGGLTLNSLAVVSGSGVTVYNTSSTGWGCSSSYSYKPITISGQVNVNLSAPTTGSLAGVVLFGDRAGCSNVGSCQDQINGSSTTTLNGAMYFKSDTLLFTGSTSNGCMMAVADKITINGNSSFAITGCTGTIGGVTVSVTPTTATLYAGQTQQFSATVTNSTNTAVTWTITPSGTGTINASGLYTAPATITTQQTVTVKATSQANPAASASSTLTLMPKTTPTITWATPAAITYGTALSATQLDATASVAGTFVYTPAAGTVLAAGTQTLSATFTPTNTTDYNTATATVSLTVNKVTPVITWATPAAITYGTALSATQLDATASVAGTFVYTPAAGTVLAAGSQTLSVTFTPTNTTDYNTATATVSLTVNKVTPVLTWAAPAAIIYGTALSATQLDATASVAGTFVYAPPAGTVLGVGTQTLSVAFTPTNTTDYATATGMVTLTVQALVLPTISAAASPAPNSNGWNNSTVTVAFTCTAGSYPIATCPSPATVTTQGANQQVCGKAVDTQGNSSAQACASVSLDETAPTITATVSPAPVGGINYGSATVTFTCSDALSGIATCPSPVTDTTIGANQNISGTATDKAGNSATGTVTLNIQPVALPTISAAASPAPNSNGWNNSTVTVAFTCTAGSFPIATCPSPATVTTQGANQQVCGKAVDTQGNSSAQACASVSLDETAPTITATVSPAPVGGINYGSATVTFTCSDALSGIATCPAPVAVTTIGSNPVSGTATDKAGNSASTSVTVNLQPSVLPTITAAASPSPNGNGWNNSTVTVTFTCTAGSYPIATCPSPVPVTTQAANQQICGKAVDTQGNSSAQACATVSLDETAPTITAAVSPAPVGGINYGSATVTFTCSDALSGVATCSSPVTDTTIGSNQKISGTVTDKAGNSTSTSVTLNIQPVVLPTISAAATPAPNSNGWNDSTVTVTFSCVAGSYPVATCPSPVPVTTQAANQQICGKAVDTQGNSSAQACATVSLDETAPTITAAVSPTPVGGINYGSATVTFTCADALSGVATCPSPVTDTTVGSNQKISGTATDKAGNSASTSVTLNIQPVVLPTISAAASPVPNGNGWNNTNVTVTYSCVAGSYPIQSCPSPVVVSTEGANQSICGHAVDTMGNSSATACATVSLDKTPPTITAAVNPAPVGGINYGSATVTFTCSDGLSGVVTCPSPVTVTTIGSTPVSGTVTDKAGNTNTTSVTVDIQAVVLPTISAAASPAPDSNGWNNSTVTVTFTCTAGSYGIATCPPPVQVTSQAAGQSFCGKATDTQGNSSAQACATVSLDETAPTITAIVTPTPVGGINYGSATVTFTCTDALSGVATCPSAVTDTTTGSTPIMGTVTDKAGNSASTSVTVNIQAVVLPSISATTSPAPNSAGWNTTAATVNFTCTAGTYPIQNCPSPIPVTSQGANQSICGHAVDTQGNSSSQVCDTVNLELTPPTISASASPAANSAGWNNTNVAISFTCTPSVSSITSCSPPQTVSSQGMGQVITGTVKDQAGNQATASVTLNIDLTPPAIVQFTAPSQLSPGQSGSASVTIADIAPIVSVTYSLSGSPVGTTLTPPYTVTVTAPVNTTSGTTLTLTATVTDVAGNVGSANVGIQVVSSGVVVGQVLSDATGLPLQGATVQVLGQASQNATSDANGKYSIPVSGSQLFLDVSLAATGSAPAMVTVERQISVQPGVGNVPVDARMTAQAAAANITASGGTVGSGAITITVPAGGATTSYYLTPLSTQGLPGLLPLGWSPLAAFDLQTNISTSAALSANFTGLPAGTLYLVSYSYTVHGWSMVTPNLTASSSGALTVSLPSTGDYALAIPDTGATIPSVGQPLTGVTMVALPATATSTGILSPGNVGPAGGTSMASLAVQSQTALPSGTVIQAEVTETYTLTSGQKLSEEPRYEDLLIYQNPAPASGSEDGATFPVTPSQTFQGSQLTSGDVHLDILSGRESVRGATGGSDPVSVQSGGATLTVAAGSLPQDTAINVTSETVDTFLPATSTLVPLAEYNLDFSGKTLSNAAQLSVGTEGLAPGTNVVIAQIDRIAGVPYLVVVSTAQVTTTNIVSQATPGLPGITQEGDYVFYELNIPTGFVSGIVSASSGPIAAMVQTDALPFVTFASAAGNYEVVAAAGTVNLTASVPNTALTGTITAQAVSGQTATANITVVGQVETATITPANGAVGVPLTAEIDLVAANGFNPATVTSSSILLTAAGNTTPVTLRFVYSLGNTKLAVFPQNALLASTQYTFQASGIANALGGLISVPTISFTTAAITVPTYNTNALVFGMPDQSGNVSITAPAASFPAGTSIQIVDQTSGIVLTLTALNDGSVSGSIPATINDTLQVTLTDSSGNQSTYTISQFVAADGTTAVGPGGGTVVGPGNTGIIIPAGALPQGVTFQLTQLDQTAFSVLPTWTGANFGSGLRITDPQMPTFQKEAKLAFPVPANAPANAFYYVYRRITDQNGNVYFETIDEAFVQGSGASAQVVTASPPFCGYHNSYGNFSIQADGAPLPVTAIDQDYFMMWDVAAGNGPAGLASTGLIVGLATQIVPAVLGVSQATTQPATGTVSIFLTAPAGSPSGTPSNVAIYDGQCATFTLFDPQLGGGTRNVTATQISSSGVNNLQATVDEVDGAQQDDGLYAIYAGLEDLYKNIGRVNFTFPTPVPPPPPPVVAIDLYTLNSMGHRAPASTILQSGANIVIAFQSKLNILSASINGTNLDVETPDSTEGAVLDNLPEQYLQSARVKGLYPVGTPGNYTLTVVGQDPISLVQSSANQNILVVAAGASNTETFSCTAAAPPADPTTGCTLPQVIGTYPVNTATGVPIGTFPEITFNEPVTNVPGNVMLLDPTGTPVPAVLVGVRAPNPNNPNQNPIANPVGPNDIITSVTIEPTNGLNYNTQYSFSLNAGAPGNCLDSQGNPQPQPTPTTFIVDLNTAPTGPFCLQPLPLPGEQYYFTTFAPSGITSTGSAYEVLTRAAVIGQIAYVGEYLSSAISGLGMFNVGNPAVPQDLQVAAGATFVGRAIDVAGQAKSPVTASGGGLVAISAGTAVDNTIPANVWLYDISSPTQPTRVGAVSVTSDTNNGIATRLFMKDQYLYTSVFRQGLQEIDLGQALTEYAQQFNASPLDFGQAVSTAGDGFAMDTIVNQIQLPLYSGGQLTGAQATMYDLKADNFTATGGGTDTLVVATGQVPFLIADMTMSGLSAVLYPPVVGGGAGLATNPVQPLMTTSTDGSTNYLLCYGTALDIGQIPVTNNSGVTSNQHDVVLVGQGIIGPAGSTTSCPSTTQSLSMVPVLAVINVNQTYNPGAPFTPTLAGMTQISTSGTDVVLNGTMAMISTGSNILLVDVANPSQPVPAGQITGNYGTWMGVSASGFGVTTAATFGATTVALNQYIVPNCGTGAILGKLVSGGGTPAPIFQTVQPTTCTISTNVPVQNLANVTVALTPTSLNSPLSATLNTQTQMFQFVIPSGTQITGSVMNGQASAVNTQTNTPLIGLVVPINVGTVHIVLDSNNDTVIDPVKDAQAAGAGTAFNFWIADPILPSLNHGDDALLDYAPMRIYASALPAASAGTIQLALVSNTTTNNPIWVITHNIGVVDGSSDTTAASNEKLYLQDQTGVQPSVSQDGSIAGRQATITNLIQNAATCGPNSVNPANTFEKVLCQSESGSIELSNLQQGTMYDILFSIVDTCFNDTPVPSNCLSDTSWSLQTQLVLNDGSNPIVLDSVPLDIRPLQQRMTVYTTRSGALQPLVAPVLFPPLPTQVPAGVPWMDIPSGATKLNVLVHGYLVTDTQATQSTPAMPAVPAMNGQPAQAESPAVAGFFPEYFKRLYWTGLPVMMAQGNVQTVGITWYGDVSEANWPDDEYSALLSGVPFASFFTQQAAAGRTMTVLAHSLGNLVMNSAINRLIASGGAGGEALGAIKSYVMNEAAVPSEAFDSPTANAPNWWLQSNASSDDGYSTDLDWLVQYNGFTSSQSSQWFGTLNGSNYVTQPQPAYYLRWTQQRPASGVPDFASANSTPARGSWLGYFAANPSNINITNTVNGYDFVLGAWIWGAAQYCEKPNIAAAQNITGAFENCFPNLGSYTATACLNALSSGFAAPIADPIDFALCVYGLDPGQEDDANKQFWANLRNTDAGQAVTWGQYCTSPSTCTHSNITRQFAELSYWFPSISYAEGTGGRPLSIYPVTTTSPTTMTKSVTTVDFSQYSPQYNPEIDPFGVLTHSFLMEQPYSDVSPAWMQIKSSLCPSCN